MNLRVLDLFCGAGGMSLGFKNAGFEIYGGIDFDQAAMETHNFNFDTKYHFCGDITKVTNQEIEDKLKGIIDGIIGGPPCQGFSAANRWQKDEDDPRNRLFLDYLRFVKIIQPKFFVIENVPQILTRDSGYAKQHILEITSELGYEVSVDVLRASDYGVPQIRRRAFFIGIRKDFNKKFDFKKIKPLFENTTVSEAIGDLMELERNASFNTLLDKNRSPLQEYYFADDQFFIENHELSEHAPNVVERIKYVPQGGNWKDVPAELWDTQRNNRHSSAYRRLDMNEPSITIDTGHMNYFHPIFHRVPTVRESARIQTFSDNFIFKGTKTQQYRQVGNAVPPVLAHAIANEIINNIKEK
ncbi:DNA cytosine methyltransferase [Globicatella sulfidifaciens]|uniref:DNA cytosine methyltransferase n=1 Tax=Globicatella sulfidifaciens TaxID=136093 RepID=UPI00288C8571|nr:DNA cytosine methyltransferase [Globicatella sulfidifaciens]MDT2768034.1 DNA cytosine methyltransferase [Globicatella sulfidifaciens]